METVAEYNNLRIPTWALSYLVNADDSGITEEDKKLVDNYMQEFYDEADKMGASVIFAEESIQIEKELHGRKYYEYEFPESYFTWQPEFGLGCDVQECTILIVK